ncbi:hypothetical protein F5Y14DRAFT_448074 [Nemania sp. NC0429]|nr:hypothetical protein F5Y14DRAFT_448074 [Nemania sp. NC0429]
MQTIRKIFSPHLQRALNSQFRFHDFSPLLDASSCSIYGENSLETLIAKSIQCVIAESLRHTSQDLLIQDVHMVKGDQARLYHSRRNRAVTARKARKSAGRKMEPIWRPDWAGVADVHGRNNILPGETKLSKNWRSERLNKYIGKEKTQDLYDDMNTIALWPMRQMLQYCVDSHARYGYIITDEELVVMKVRPSEECPPGATMEDLRLATLSSAIIEYQSIPWERSDSSDSLSVKLALYVLFILAANNGLLDWTYTIRRPWRQVRTENGAEVPPVT